MDGASTSALWRGSKENLLLTLARKGEACLVVLRPRKSRGCLRRNVTQVNAVQTEPNAEISAVQPEPIAVEPEPKSGETCAICCAT